MRLCKFLLTSDADGELISLGLASWSMQRITRSSMRRSKNSAICWKNLNCKEFPYSCWAINVTYRTHSKCKNWFNDCKCNESAEQRIHSESSDLGTCHRSKIEKSVAIQYLAKKRKISVRAVRRKSLLAVHRSRCSRHHTAMVDSTFEIEQSFVKNQFYLQSSNFSSYLWKRTIYFCHMLQHWFASLFICPHSRTRTVSLLLLLLLYLVCVKEQKRNLACWSAVSSVSLLSVLVFLTLDWFLLLIEKRHDHENHLYIYKYNVF